MSDRRPEHPKLYEPCEVCGLFDEGEHFDQAGDWCDGAGGREVDPVAAVRRGVESGTIKGMRAWHCVSQMDLALYERPHWCRGMGHDDCGWALVLVDESSVVHGKRVNVTDGPVSDGGSET